MRRIPSRSVASSFWFFWLTFGAFAQTGAVRSSFDVVSVKRTPPERRNQLKSERCTNGGPFIVEGTPLLWTIEFAYHLKDADLAGAPGWLESFDDAYDITGKPEGRVTDEQCRQMVQSLLADRFHLMIHHETRERPVVFLVVAKTGPKVHQVQPDSADSDGVRFNGRHPAFLSEDKQPPGWSMTRLANFLADLLDDHRPVVDKTGLTGIYAFNLDYSKDGVNGPLLGPALQEQLGLVLQAGKAAIDTVVIDHIERASGN